MELNTLTTILVATVPALSTVITLIGVVIKIMKQTKVIKQDSIDIITQKTTRMEQSFKDLAILKTKIASIEKFLIEDKKEKGKK